MAIPYTPQRNDTTFVTVGEEGKFLLYEDFVCALVKERGTLNLNLEHMIIGCCGEAGELADAIKKHTIYDKVLDLNNVIEELGDLEFFMTGLRQLLHLNREDILQANANKLQKRYAGLQYSDQAAQSRADKQEVPTQPDLQIIDMSKQISDEQVAAVDETSEVEAGQQESKE